MFFLNRILTIEISIYIYIPRSISFYYPPLEFDFLYSVIQEGIILKYFFMINFIQRYKEGRPNSTSDSMLSLFSVLFIYVNFMFVFACFICVYLTVTTVQSIFTFCSYLVFIYHFWFLKLFNDYYHL